MDLKRGIDKAVTALLDELRTLSKPISTNREIAQVGSIPSETAGQHESQSPGQDDNVIDADFREVNRKR